MKRKIEDVWISKLIIDMYREKNPLFLGVVWFLPLVFVFDIYDEIIRFFNKKEK